MTPHDFARKTITDYGVALDVDADGLVEELQAAALVLAGMVIALHPEPELVTLSGDRTAHDLKAN